MILCLIQEIQLSLLIKKLFLQLVNQNLILKYLVSLAKKIGFENSFTENKSELDWLKVFME